MRQYLALSMFLILLILFSVSVCAFEVYSGSIVVSSARLSITAGPSASVSAVYTLVNKGTQTERVNVSFPGYSSILYNAVSFSGPLELRAGASAQFTTSQPLTVTEDSILLNPEVLINGDIPDARFAQLYVAMELSDPALSISSSSIPFFARTEGGYVYEAFNVYPQLISVRWAQNMPSLELSRTVHNSFTSDGVVRIVSRVTNIGSADIQNLELRDTFLSAWFEPASEREHFIFVEQPNEPFYRWTATIPILAAGSSAEFLYSVRAVSPRGALLPLRAFVGGTFVRSFEGPLFTPHPASTLFGTGGVGFDSSPIIGSPDTPDMAGEEYDLAAIENETARHQDISILFLGIIAVLVAAVGLVGYRIYRSVQRRRYGF